MRRVSLVTVALLSILLELATNAAASEFPRRWQPWLWLSWPALGLLAAVVIGAEVRRVGAEVPADGADIGTARPGPANDQERLPLAVGALADAIGQQWTREARLRGLLEHRMLRLPWSITDRPVLPQVMAILDGGKVGGRPRRLRLRGDVTAIVDTFLALPKHQLVIIGVPGAGKTVIAMLLTLGLLERRAAGNPAPVPVLLAISSWQPERERLDEWVARRLIEDYPALANTEVFGPDAAARLVAERWVFPVLDGMDELPAPLQAEAIAAINRDIGADNPLVVTCRSDEYETAVTTSGMVPEAAAVIELRPVDRSDTIAFLSSGRVDNDPRWAKTLACLRQQNEGPLAQAMRTPLMIALLRTAYSDPASRPDELLDHDRFPDHASIERHLLDMYLPAAYAERDVPPKVTIAPRQPPSWIGPERAVRWLSSLAEHLDRQGTYELAWWQMYGAFGARKMRLAVGVCICLAATLLTTTAVWIAAAPTAGLKDALLIALIAGPVTGCAAGTYAAVTEDPPSFPSRINFQVRGRLGPLAGKIIAGLWRGSVGGLVVGLAAGVSYTSFFDLDTQLRSVLSFGLLLGPAAGIVIGLAFGLSDWSHMPADSVRAPSPVAMLRADRAARVVQLLVSGLMCGGSVGLTVAAVAGPAFGLLDGISAGLLGVVMGLARGLGAWSWFVIVRGWLAIRRQSPWRLMTFLDDADQLGVLRRTGGVYQFRHARLQDRLARPGMNVPARAAEGGAPAVPQASRQGGSGQAQVRRLALVYVTLVLLAGPSLGVGVPLAAGVQSHCGRTPFSPAVKFLRSGVDGECVGVTDGSYVFDPGLYAIERSIKRENAFVHRSSQSYVRIALLMPFTASSNSVFEDDQIRHAVEGAYIAQVRVNHVALPGGSAPKIELVLGNEGSHGQHWRTAVDQLLDGSKVDHRLVAVVGMGADNVYAWQAARMLSRHGIAMVASALKADVLGEARIPGLVTVSPSNADQVKALRHYVSMAHLRKGVLVHGEGGQRSTKAFQTMFADLKLTHFVYSSPNSEQATNWICAERPDVVLFAGGGSSLRGFVESALRRPCNAPLTIMTTAITQPFVSAYEQKLRAEKIRIIYASPVDVVSWSTRRADRPSGYPAFASAYRNLISEKSFPVNILDGFAIMHHDAFTAAAAAIHRAVNVNWPLHAPSAAEVCMELTRPYGANSVEGAGGKLAFSKFGSPEGRLVPVIQTPGPNTEMPPLYHTPIG